MFAQVGLVVRRTVLFVVTLSDVWTTWAVVIIRVDYPYSTKSRSYCSSVSYRVRLRNISEAIFIKIRNRISISNIKTDNH